MKKIIEVALPTGSLNKNFSYSAEVEEGEDVAGRRVVVPFKTRVLTGTALGFTEDTGEFEIKPIIKFQDDTPIFDKNMMTLLRRVAEYYCCPIGEVLKASMPPNISPKSIEGIITARRFTADEIRQMKVFEPEQARIIEYLKTRKKPVKLQKLKKQFDFPIPGGLIQTMTEQGYIEYFRNVEAAVKKKKADAVRIRPEKTPEEIAKFLAGTEKRAPKQHALLAELSKYDKPILQKRALQNANSSSAALRALIDKGIVKKFKVTVDRETESSGSLSSRDESKLSLTEEQQFALDSIREAVDARKYETFLLHGVTGSGKTLIYIHAIARAVSLGKSAILLVPEISLTPQLLDRFERVFPGKIAAMHSRLSDGLRLDAFDKIISGEKTIVIGARSAVFAPVKNLGLIIVDEEHETSYKQTDPQPRYHGRDTAIMRAYYENAVCVLGSATPAFESMHNAREGRYKLLSIKGRADGAVMPEVDIIDMLDARKSGKTAGSFSISLINEIISKLNKKEGIILFLNRRGYAPFVECQECGHIPVCKHCDVTLTLHKKKNRLVCHHCGYYETLPEKCPDCNSELKEVGFGTQRIEEDLAEILKDNNLTPKIKRIDLDTTRRKGAFRKILTDFAEGNTDILIGTQMLAKGLDFSRCTLVGVINADLQLFIDDFRSSERTFQLLTQVSGRAGRSRDKGTVIIQTNHPDNPAISKAKNAEYESFCELELRSREQTQFPPFTRFSTVEFSSKDYHQVRLGSNIFRDNLPDTPSIIAYDPIEPFLSRVKDIYRIIIPLKSIKQLDRSGSELRAAIRKAKHACNREDLSKLSIKIDIDSYSVM